MLYMLDTDVASYLMKGRSPKIEARLATISPALICISVMTLAEIKYGLKKLGPDHQMHRVMRQFLNITQVLSWNREAAEFYADIRHQLVTSGQPIGEIDMMIAAHSLAVNATLVTNNIRHFTQISAPLILQDWT